MVPHCTWRAAVFSSGSYHYTNRDVPSQKKDEKMQKRSARAKQSPPSAEKEDAPRGTKRQRREDKEGLPPPAPRSSVKEAVQPPAAPRDGAVSKSVVHLPEAVEGMERTRGEGDDTVNYADVPHPDDVEEALVAEGEALSGAALKEFLQKHFVDYIDECLDDFDDIDATLSGL